MASKKSPRPKTFKPTLKSRSKGTAGKPTAKRVPLSKAAMKAKRVSALDAAAQVLSSGGKPMRAGDLVTAMEAKDLWKSPQGKTPAATLHAAMIREIKAKGKGSRFRKVERGLFTAA